MKILSIFLMAIMLATSVLACSCLQMPSVSEAFNSSDVVFSGTVDNIYDEPYTGAPNGPDILKVFFIVDSSWKGVDDQNGNSAMNGPLIVFTAQNSAACGYEFEEGKTYLVYATRNDDGELFTSLCSRTRSIEDATEDFEFLGEGITPIENDSDDNSDRSWFSSFIDFFRNLFVRDKIRAVDADESAPPTD